MHEKVFSRSVPKIIIFFSAGGVGGGQGFLGTNKYFRRGGLCLSQNGGMGVRGVGLTTICFAGKFRRSPILKPKMISSAFQVDNEKTYLVWFIWAEKNLKSFWRH